MVVIMTQQVLLQVRGLAHCMVSRAFQKDIIKRWKMSTNSRHSLTTYIKFPCDVYHLKVLQRIISIDVLQIHSIYLIYQL
jgi:hypothetical protein